MSFPAVLVLPSPPSPPHCPSTSSPASDHYRQITPHASFLPVDNSQGGCSCSPHRQWFPETDKHKFPCNSFLFFLFERVKIESRHIYKGWGACLHPGSLHCEQD